MVEVIRMLINYDIEKLNKALEDFYNSTCVNIQFLTSDFVHLTGNLEKIMTIAREFNQQRREGRVLCMEFQAII